VTDLPPLGILRGTRVVDVSTGIAGAYATKLFADVGADVVNVEMDGGDPYRRRYTEADDLRLGDAALFRFLHAGKRSITGRIEDDHVQGLIERADLVVESSLPLQPDLDVDELLERIPRLVVLSFSPYGRSGPWRDRLANDFIVQAESGVIAWHGRQDQIPFQSGGRIIDWTSAVIGAVGALAAVRRARNTGRGEHVDCSMQATATYSSVSYMDAQHILTGPPDLKVPARSIQAPSIEPTSDGWVGFVVLTADQFERFLMLIDRADLIGDRRWYSSQYRSERLQEWNAIVHPWTRAHTTREVVDLATSLRLPVSRVNDGPGVLSEEHFRIRGAFGDSADGEFQQPQPPYTFDGQRPRPQGPAPTAGSTDCLIDWAPRDSRSVGQPCSRPLEGIRVLDATGFWAGPAAGHVLALLGADVIHLESVGRIEPGRTLIFSTETHQKWWETGYLWNFNNHDKRDLTLSLAHEEGRQLVKSLIRTCDVLIENFSPRVFDGFGLDFAGVAAINPEIVFARMPAFGLDGPLRENTGFAQTIEAITGMASITGHVDDQPRNQRGPVDLLGGYHTVFAVLLGLERRDQTGQGAAIEVPLAESGLNAAAEVAIEFSAYGRILPRVGNRSLDAAPQGLYACDGHENWLAISVVNDQQWDGLKAVMGNPDWAEKVALSSMKGRRKALDLLDLKLTEWAIGRDLEPTVDLLLRHGVPAGVARDPRTMMRHPQLRAFGYYEDIDHPVLGRQLMPTIPFRYKSIEKWTTTPAPSLGQHNEEILIGDLGLKADDIERLGAMGIIGTRPTGT
jgi:crotonobetainyl-CoA:carnitine CoA-transferase CaiB-like acyl-CoA transferase